MFSEISRLEIAVREGSDRDAGQQQRHGRRRAAARRDRIDEQKREEGRPIAVKGSVTTDAVLHPLTKAATAPSTAPGPTPVRLGSARGLRNRLCMIAPAVASPAPTTAATTTRQSNQPDDRVVGTTSTTRASTSRRQLRRQHLQHRSPRHRHTPDHHRDHSADREERDRRPVEQSAADIRAHDGASVQGPDTASTRCDVNGESGRNSWLSSTTMCPMRAALVDAIDGRAARSASRPLE